MSWGDEEEGDADAAPTSPTSRRSTSASSSPAARPPATARWTRCSTSSRPAAPRSPSPWSTPASTCTSGASRAARPCCSTRTRTRRGGGVTDAARAGRARRSRRPRARGPRRGPDVPVRARRPRRRHRPATHSAWSDRRRSVRGSRPPGPQAPTRGAGACAPDAGRPPTTAGNPRVPCCSRG